MSRFIIGSRAALLGQLRAQDAPLAVAEASSRATAAAGTAAAVAAFDADERSLRDVFDAARVAFESEVAALKRVRDARVAAHAATAELDAALLAVLRKPDAERRRAVVEELFFEALFLVAQFPGGQVAEAAKCCYAFDVRLCAGLCRATWAEEALWSGLVRVSHPGPRAVTRLMCAAARGDAARVAWLLARGAPREAKDAEGWTALCWASWQGRTDAVRALLAAGAAVDAADNDGMTPLYVAAHAGHADAVSALLAAGAGFEAAHHSSARPLHISSYRGHEGVTALLLNVGADVNALDNDGHSPFALAQTPAMRALLAARGGV